MREPFWGDGLLKFCAACAWIGLVVSLITIGIRIAEGGELGDQVSRIATNVCVLLLVRDCLIYRDGIRSISGRIDNLSTILRPRRRDA